MVRARTAGGLVVGLVAGRFVVGLAAVYVLHVYAWCRTRAEARAAGIDPDRPAVTPPG